MLIRQNSSHAHKNSHMAGCSTSHCEVLKVRDSDDVEKRHAGCGAVIEGKLYLWGGETSENYDITLDDDEEEEEEGEEDEEEEEIPQKQLSRPVDLPKPPNYPFDIFDLTTLTWSTKNTSGQVPKLGIGSTLSYHSGTHSMYLYGGWNGMKSPFADVYCVSLDTWEWECIVLPEGAIKPSPRYLTGMLVHGNKLCNFGGVGPDIIKFDVPDGKENQDVGAKYYAYEDKGVVYDYGWNSEYYEFDVIERRWEAPMSRTGAQRPPASGAHVFAKFDSHQAVLFGGRTKEGRKDDTWIFDLDKREFTGPLDFEPKMKPKHRVFSTLCPLVDPELVGHSLCSGGPPVEQKLLLLWGKEHLELIIPDCWLFNCQTKTWTKMELGEVGRYWHIACSYFNGSRNTTHSQVVVYGGGKHDTSAEAVQFCGVKGLTLLSFGVKPLKKLCLSVIVNALELSRRVPDLHHFPDYVPTTIKREVLDSYSAHTQTTSHSRVEAQSTHMPQSHYF